MNDWMSLIKQQTNTLLCRERFYNLNSIYETPLKWNSIIFYLSSTVDSFKSLGRWLEDVKKYAGKCLHQMLIGNKCDLSHRREVSEEEAKNFVTHYGIGDTLETSAKVCL